MKDMPQKPLEHLALPNACGVEPGEKGKTGVVQVNGKAECKENLKQFIDSTHQKAAQVVQWMGQIDETANERCVKIMAAEHTFKLLLTEMKKRKREDVPPGDEPGGDGVPSGKSKSKAGRRPKAKAKTEK
eukprot:s2239_g6.t1